MSKKIIIPNPFELSSFKGFKFSPVLNPKTIKKYGNCFLHLKTKNIYFNPVFIDKLKPSQKIYIACTQVFLYKMKNEFKAQEKAFNYCVSKYKINVDEIGELITSLSFGTKKHKDEIFWNFVTESEEVVRARKKRTKRINFLKSLFLWKK